MIGIFGVFGVLAIIIGLLVAFHTIKDFTSGYGQQAFLDWFLAGFFGLIFGLISGGLTISIGFLPHHIWGEKTIEKYNIEIVSVHNQNGIVGQAGGFLVFSCQIKDVDYFTFYHKVENIDNTYEKAKIEAENTIIHESEGTPRVEYKMENKHSKIWLGEYKTTKLNGKYHLYVPKGSIYREFVLK